MLKLSILIAIGLLSGCAATAPPNAELPRSSGGGGHTISCGGLERNWAACHQRASDLCEDRGYSVLARSEDSSPMFFLARFSPSPQRTSYRARSMIHREFVIECRKPTSASWGPNHVETVGWQGS